MQNKKSLISGLILIVLVFSSCKQQDESADAYGHFESDEFILSAEMSGKLAGFTIQQGDEVHKGDTLGRVDHETLLLQLKGFPARREAILAKTESVRAQKEVARAEIGSLQSDMERIGRLANQGAATERQYENLQNQLQTAQKRLEAYDPQIRAILSELKVLKVEEEVAWSNLSKAILISPVSGRVLNAYASSGEMVLAGKPVLEVAKTDTMFLKAYVSGQQLAAVSLGQKVLIKVDDAGGGFSELEGTVSWVSDQAEFTPKIIQTREERVDLVYAMKIAVRNPGYLKIGMPGELWLQ